MADQGKRLDADDQRRIARLAQVTSSKTEIARIVGVSRPTAYKYAAKENSDKAVGTFYSSGES